MLRLYLYARVRVLKRKLHTGPRVQRAPGLPCALHVPEGQKKMQTSGDPRREIMGSRPMFDAVTASQHWIPACTADDGFQHGIHCLHSTTPRCNDSRCGYDAPADPAKALEHRRAQSDVTMSPSKMRMTGQQSNYFFVHAF